jgi:hydrogenase expression/formation protein HypD
LAAPYGEFDALRRFGVALDADCEHPACRCGDVLRGRSRPDECPLFGRSCTPFFPLGPCMVSSEGTCAAWYRYESAGADAARRRRPAHASDVSATARERMTGSPT